MRTLGEFCLLAAFVGAGFSAFGCVVGTWRGHRLVRTAGLMAGVISVAALSIVVGALAWALYTKDFSFAYVAQYSSKLLPSHYSLSALWVGQAGSLLLWAFVLGVIALVCRFKPRRETSAMRDPTFGVLMGYLAFLIVVIVFAADPMDASLAAPHDGAGLSPLLQHPAMLIHPPIVFLGYALWTVPFAMACVALVSGRADAGWIREARPWALVAWTVLGVGILLGADWAYEELGWGGYWSWDPVENGSLLPWLTGTALIHGMMAWQFAGVLKKTAFSLALVTFGLCNFATFLTRSGVFSSVHAFSKSPIGWLFLALMAVLLIGGAVILLVRRWLLAAQGGAARSILCRESLVLVSIVSLLLLTAVVVTGTCSTALSTLFSDKPIVVGPAFYNNVLIPTGLTLLLTTAMAPLLRWKVGPSQGQNRWLMGSACAGGVTAILTAVMVSYHPLALAAAGIAVGAVVALAGALILDGQQRHPARPVWGVVTALRCGRGQYAGFLIHLGLVSVALGIVGSSLGHREQEFVMTQGQTVAWAGRDVRLMRRNQRDLADRIVAEAELEIARGGRVEATLVPAQHFHRLQQEWTTEVAIQSTWGGDFYTILHSGTADGQVSLTFVENPMMRWLWLGGGIIVAGALIRLWPQRLHDGNAALAAADGEDELAEETARSVVTRPHWRKIRSLHSAGDP
ncbi:MAG: heme lyase CcmF/NrfE family subunit [Planctomycetia bacterium]|nr:heme lyase CcmF/NrfE family subunit [Planctomycetia bacterium]